MADNLTAEQITEKQTSRFFWGLDRNKTNGGNESRIHESRRERKMKNYEETLTANLLAKLHHTVQNKGEHQENYAQRTLDEVPYKYANQTLLACHRSASFYSGFSTCVEQFCGPAYPVSEKNEETQGYNPINHDTIVCKRVYDTECCEKFQENTQESVYGE